MAWLEDFTVGQRAAFGRHAVTRAAVIAFAATFDPQPFHLSDAAAADSPFGRLAASGWHTAAMTMAMIVANLDGGKGGDAVGVGVDELRWLAPVYPGDILRCESEVVDVLPSRSRPDRGVVRTRMTVFNQDDVAVLRETVVAQYRRRPVR